MNEGYKVLEGQKEYGEATLRRYVADNKLIGGCVKITVECTALTDETRRAALDHALTEFQEKVKDIVLPQLPGMSGQELKPDSAAEIDAWERIATGHAADHKPEEQQ